MKNWNLEQHGSVATATFERPPRNLMTMAAMTELEGVLESVASDESVSVLVLTGGVPGYFVAHADTEDLAALGRGEQVEGDPGSWNRAFALIESMPQPVVAAVNGQAWGGGCELSLACTMRIAAQSAHFGQPEVAVGIIPGAGGTQRLARLIGLGKAAELVLTGSIIDAQEAHRVGLVQAVLPDDGFSDHVATWVERIAAHPQGAVRAAKRALVDGLALSLADGLALEGQLFIERQLNPESVRLEEEANERYRNADPDDQVTLG